jgi:hypothetical protein
VVFPLTGSERSTQPVGRRVVAASTSRVDTAASDAARDEAHWYRSYPKHFRELTRLSASGHVGLIAADGLTAFHSEMRFRRQGAEGSIAEALEVPRAHYLSGHRVRGHGMPDTTFSLVDEEARVSGDAALRLLDRWQADAVGEPSAIDALRAVAAHPEWLDLSDTTVVVLGAASEMGPLEPLLRWGAHVVAVDLPGPHVWRPIIELARRSAGRLTVPVRGGINPEASDGAVAARAGTDVINEAPEIAAWLAHLPGPLVVGDYVYAPGSTQVRTAAAVDAVIARLLDRRSDISLAYLATPTDVYAVPSEAVELSRRRYQESTVMVSIARELGGRRIFRPAYERVESLPTGQRYGLMDALITQQGPNYALAKRVQRWRAARARAQGVHVSINVAPATRSRSVVTNPVIASAYGGAHRFGLHVFSPAASRLAMAALLVHDLRNEAAVANPAVPVDSCMDLLAAGAMHGGMWRAPFAPRSVLAFAAATGRLQR